MGRRFGDCHRRAPALEDSKKDKPPERACKQDNKRKFDEQHADDIYWLWDGLQQDPPLNMLLDLCSDERDRIFAEESGQKRLNQLFREVKGRIVGRQTVLTVGQQDDSPKRARDTRRDLRKGSIVVLGHQDQDPKIAKALELTVPVKGEWVAARLKRATSPDESKSFQLYGDRWNLATGKDPVEEAPVLPKSADCYGC